VDSGVGPGGEVTPMYDPMVAKLIVWDVDRETATRRMLRALHEYEITELKTLIPFHQALLATDQWRNAETCRDLIEDRKWLKQLAFPKAEPAEGAEGQEEPKLEQDYTVEVSGQRFEVKVIGPPGGAANGAAPPGSGLAAKPQRREGAGGSAGGGGGGDALASPIQGTVLKVAVEQGAQVEEGALIAVVEAMKMENEITAHKGGTVKELPIAVGASVATGDTLAVIATEAD
jgi:acetyl-CoA/propionyl-CoA carboxylase biotin carboxyl carrier protein